MARNDAESGRKQLLARLTSLKQHFSRKSDIYWRAVWTVLLLPLSVLQQHTIQSFLHLFHPHLITLWLCIDMKVWVKQDIKRHHLEFGKTGIDA